MSKIYTFDNFNLDVNSSSFIIIVVGVAVGLLFGIISSVICKSVSGKVVKSLRRLSASDEGSAVTVHDMGLDKNLFLRFVLKPNSALYKAISCVPCFTSAKETRIDYEKSRFFLPEEKRISAETRFAPEPHPIMTIVLACVLVTAAAFFAIFVIPELLTMLDNFITQVQPESKYL